MQTHTPLSSRHTADEMKKAIKGSQDAAYTVRLKAILLRKQEKTPQEIARQLMISERSVTHWVLQYNDGGFTALTTKPSGRPKGDQKWSADIFTDLCIEIDKGGYWSIPRMQQWLKEHKGKDIPEQTVWVRMDKLKYSYKSSRPSPVQGDTKKQESFKKGGLQYSWSR